MRSDGPRKMFLGLWFTPTIYDAARSIEQPRIVDVRVECSDEYEIAYCETVLRYVRQKFLDHHSWAWRLWDVVDEELHARIKEALPDEATEATERLLGDWVESLFKWTGIQWMVYAVAGALGMNCGCAARRKTLNDLHRKLRGR